MKYETKLIELADFAKVARGSMSLPQFSAAIKAKLGREQVDISVLHAELKSGKLKLPDGKAAPSKPEPVTIEAKTVSPLKEAERVKEVEHVRVVETAENHAPVQVLVQMIPSANHELRITGTWQALVARTLAWLQPYALGLATGLLFANAFRRVVG